MGCEQSGQLYRANTTKLYRKGQNLSLRYAATAMQGWREKMEDRYIASLDVSDSVSVFGIFDGHGGSYVSNLAQQTFIKELKGYQYFIDKNYQEALIHTFLRIDKIITDREKCVRPSRNS